MGAAGAMAGDGDVRARDARWAPGGGGPEEDPEGIRSRGCASTAATETAIRERAKRPGEPEKRGREELGGHWHVDKETY